MPKRASGQHETSPGFPPYRVKKWLRRPTQGGRPFYFYVDCGSNGSTAVEKRVPEETKVDRHTLYVNEFGRPRRHRRGFAVLLLFSLLLLPALSCGGGKEGPPGGRHAKGNRPGGGPNKEEKSIVVKIEPAVRESITSDYSTSTTLRAEWRSDVIARTNGVIERLAVEEGAVVKEGQSLAYLENDEQTIAAARAKTTRDTRKREEERLQDIFEQNLISEDEFEKAKREAEDAEHAFKLADLELSRTVIRAPFSGVILKRHLDVGATVSNGTPIYEIADLNPLFADINIPERHVSRIQAGQMVKLSADATGAEVAARIDRISPMVEAETGTVKVTVAVEGASDLRPGAFVRVDIITDTHDDALVVPRPALVAEGSRWFLYRLMDDGASVEQLQVELGFESGDRVEIVKVIDNGRTMEDGNKVVVVGASALSDGSKVRVSANGEPGSENAG